MLGESFGGGLGSAAIRHATWFQDHGWDVLLMAREGVDPPSEIEARTWSLPPTALSATAMLQAAGEVRQVLRERPTAIIHCHGLRAFAAARLATTGTVCVTLHGTGAMASDPRAYARMRRFGHRITPLLAAAALDVAPPDVPGWRFLPHASPTLARLEVAPWDAAAEIPTFLWLGRLGEPKQPELFVRAIAAASRQGRLRGLIAGDGPLQARLEKVIADLNVDVRLLGRVDPAPALREAWAVALFSRREGVPFALEEAMWVGRGVVATRLPGIEWLAADGGIYADDVAAAAAAFESLADAGVAQALGRRAETLVRERLAPDDPWPAVAELYDRLLDSRSDREPRAF